MSNEFSAGFDQFEGQVDELLGEFDGTFGAELFANLFIDAGSDVVDLLGGGNQSGVIVVIGWCGFDGFT